MRTSVCFQNRWQFAISVIGSVDGIALHPAGVGERDDAAVGGPGFRVARRSGTRHVVHHTLGQMTIGVVAAGLFGVERTACRRLRL